MLVRVGVGKPDKFNGPFRKNEEFKQTPVLK